MTQQRSSPSRPWLFPTLLLLAGAAFGIALLRLVPELADVNPWWWVTLAILLVSCVVYGMFTGWNKT